MNKVVRTQPAFFAGKVGAARLFFFTGLIIVIGAVVMGVIGYRHYISYEPYEFAVLAAVFLGALGFGSMISGGIQISTICEGGSPEDFY